MPSFIEQRIQFLQKSKHSLKAKLSPGVLNFKLQTTLQLALCYQGKN